MRLILAVSANGVMALGPKDDMAWTPKDDKAAFRLLTSVGGVYGAGSTTFDAMPELPGRRGYRITRSPGLHTGSPGASMTLDGFAQAFPDAWLLGGPTVGLAALEAGYVDQVYLCRNEVYFPEPGPRAILDPVSPWLMSRGETINAGDPWRRTQRIRFGEVTVDVWRGLCPSAIVRAVSGAG